MATAAIATVSSKEFGTLDNSSVCEQNEMQLIKAAKSGHASAFDVLFERAAPRLYYVAHRITRNHEDAQDVVQNALLSAFRHISEFDGRSSFPTWLTRIAINSALMTLRKRRTLLEVSMDGSDDSGVDRFCYETPDRAPDPEKRYAQAQREGMLREAIQKLRPAQRKVVQLQQLHELSMQETAECIGLSLAAAKGRFFHAKISLRKSPILKAMQPTRSGARKRVLRLPLQNATSPQAVEKFAEKAAQLEVVPSAEPLHDRSRNRKKSQTRQKNWTTNPFPMNRKFPEGSAVQGFCA